MSIKIKLIKENKKNKVEEGFGIDPQTLVLGGAGLFILYKMFFGTDAKTSEQALEGVRKYIDKKVAASGIDGAGTGGSSQKPIDYSQKHKDKKEKMRPILNPENPDLKKMQQMNLEK